MTIHGITILSKELLFLSFFYIPASDKPLAGTLILLSYQFNISLAGAVDHPFIYHHLSFSLQSFTLVKEISITVEQFAIKSCRGCNIVGVFVF